MNILALDTASHKVGFAVYKNRVITAHGSMRLREKGETDNERTQSRMIALYDKVCSLIKKLNVTQVVVEDIFKDNDPRKHSAAEILGMCKGVVINTNYISGLPPVIFINPLHVKNVMWGYTSSRKSHREMKRDEQKACMCRAVERLGYQLNTTYKGNKDNDQADAIGILITYLYDYKIPIVHPCKSNGINCIP